MAEEHGFCEVCTQEVPVDEGEMVVTDRTYVDHMLVSEDQEFVCNRCIEEAEEAQVERSLSSRYWAGHEDFRRRYG